MWLCTFTYNEVDDPFDAWGRATIVGTADIIDTEAELADWKSNHCYPRYGKIHQLEADEIKGALKVLGFIKKGEDYDGSRRYRIDNPPYV